MGSLNYFVFLLDHIWNHRRIPNFLTQGGWASHCGNHPFWYRVNHLFKKSQEVIQTIVQDLSFFTQNYKDEHLSAFVLHRRIVCHP